MRGKKFWVLLAIVVLSLALITASPLFYRLLFGILVIPLFGYVASVMAVRGISGEVRRLTPFLQVGGEVEEQVILRSNHWWPKLLLEVEHETRPFGAGGKVVTLWPYQSTTWAVRKQCERRGLYEYGGLQITSRDPLGLFQRSVRVGEPQTTLIYPATVEIPGFFVPSGQGWTEGVVKGATFAPSPVAVMIREYRTGDAMGHIHWPATARAGKLMVKEFEREPAGPANAMWVVLDLDASFQAGEGVETTVEYGVTVAASIARRFLDTGQMVGMVLGGQDAVIISPGTGPAQLGRVLQALALAEPGQHGLAEISETTTEEIASGSCVVIVSSSPVEAVSEAATPLQAQGATVVPVLIERDSFAGRPPARGEQYRLPGAAFSAYVIHRGDEIERRLDFRIHGGRPEPMPVSMVAR